MNKIKAKIRGFSLVEVMVSMAVLVLVVFSATTLLVSIIRANNENMSRMVAYGLAQEGIEAIRNIRDSDWLLGADFSGKVGSGGAYVPWVSASSGFSSSGMESCYVLDYGVWSTSGISPVVNVSDLAGKLPWMLTSINCDSSGKPTDDSKTLLKKVVSDRGGRNETFFMVSSGVVSSEDTPFHRFIRIKAQYVNKNGVLPGASTKPANRYVVTSVVYWNESGRDAKVELNTELTDWKQNIY